MTDRPTDSLSELSDTVKGSWHRFLDVYEPLRADLFRYCRYLTRSPWDAEDLAQDTLARAFVTLGCMAAAPPNPRAWLFRVASNLWIDKTRRMREDPGAVVPEAAAGHEPRAAREAAGTLIARLSPQERAAVVLKEVFELTLDEIAESLSTTVGAVKAALHRARHRSPYCAASRHREHRGRRRPHRIRARGGAEGRVPGNDVRQPPARHSRQERRHGSTLHAGRSPVVAALRSARAPRRVAPPSLVRAHGWRVRSWPQSRRSRGRPPRARPELLLHAGLHRRPLPRARRPVSRQRIPLLVVANGIGPI